MGIDDELACYEVADFLVRYVQTGAANGIRFGAQGWGYPGGPCMCLVLDLAWRTQGWDEDESVYWRDLNNASRATRLFERAFGLDTYQVDAIIRGWDLHVTWSGSALLLDTRIRSIHERWGAVGAMARLAYDRSLLDSARNAEEAM